MSLNIEEKIYDKIDEVIPILKELKAIVYLQEHAKHRLAHLYNSELESMIDNSIKLLYEAQDERIPF